MIADRELVGEIADRHLPGDIAAQWLRLLRPAAALRHARPGAQVAAVLGGEPDLPDSDGMAGVEGPRAAVQFIAAIDCAALAVVSLDISLPGAGMLLFFYFDGQYDNGETTVGCLGPANAGRRMRAARRARRGDITAGVPSRHQPLPAGGTRR